MRWLTGGAVLACDSGWLRRWVMTERVGATHCTVRPGYDGVRHTDLVTLADTLRAAATGPNGDHLYLSTACMHGEHEHCRSTVNVEGGPKTSGTCKFCDAVCVCDDCDHGGPA